MIFVIHAFYKWLARRWILTLADMPELPTVKCNMNMRILITVEDREKVLEKLYDLVKDYNERIYVAIYMLLSYPSIRPIELLRLKERDIIWNFRKIRITDRKNKDWAKVVPILDDDFEKMASLEKGFPEQHVFRYNEKSAKGRAKSCDSFGERLLREWWYRACAKVGIKGVDF